MSSIPLTAGPPLVLVLLTPSWLHAGPCGGGPDCKYCPEGAQWGVAASSLSNDAAAVLSVCSGRTCTVHRTIVNAIGPRAIKSGTAAISTSAELCGSGASWTAASVSALIFIRLIVTFTPQFWSCLTSIPGAAVHAGQASCVTMRRTTRQNRFGQHPTVLDQ